jgi:hypothetical protein
MACQDTRKEESKQRGGQQDGNKTNQNTATTIAGHSLNSCTNWTSTA